MIVDVIPFFSFAFTMCWWDSSSYSVKTITSRTLLTLLPSKRMAVQRIWKKSMNRNYDVDLQKFPSINVLNSCKKKRISLLSLSLYKAGSDAENLLNVWAHVKRPLSYNFFMSSMIRHEFDLISIFLCVCWDLNRNSVVGKITTVTNNDNNKMHSNVSKRTVSLCAWQYKGKLKLIVKSNEMKRNANKRKEKEEGKNASAGIKS